MAKTLVWIEDDADIIFPVVELLERQGHRILRIRTVAEALDNITLIRGSDLILLDIIVPPGNTSRSYSRYSGVGLLRELRTEYGIEKPVVVLSVVRDSEVHNQLHELGVQVILTKPVLPSKLKEEVDRLLDIS